MTQAGSGHVGVSVLVPLRNEKGFISHLISCALAQAHPGVAMEFILVDGMSTDGTHDALCTAVVEINDADGSGDRPAFRILQNPAMHVSHALNLGLAAARGEYIIRWDAHTSYADDYVKTCVETLERTGAWNVGGPARTAPTRRIQRAIAAAYHSPFSVGGARFHDVDYEGPVDTVTYGCWRRSTLEALGGFDEELIRNQDDELNLRIVRAGGLVYQTPRIRSWYRPRASLISLFRQYLQYGFWKVKVIRKHKLPASFRHLIPVLFVLGLLVGPILSLWSPYRELFLLGLGVYVLLTVAFSIAASVKHGRDLLAVLPLVFLTYHLSYGIGFLIGICTTAFGVKTTSLPSILSGLTR